jgi:hypothetical protein
MSVSVIGKTLKTSASGPYLGFALQPLRFCLQLLQVEDGAKVSLELLDDVAVHAIGGQTVLEQCKSITGRGGLTDKSVELWKTFANWADICDSQALDPSGTAFVLYLVPGRAGQLVYELQAATTAEAAATVLSKVKKWLTPAAAKKGAGPHIERFLAHGDEKCVAIIRNFSFVPEPDPIEALRRLLRATIPETAINDFAAAAIGMAEQQAQRLMRDRLPPIVDATGFRTGFHAFVRKYNLAGLLNPTIGAPARGEIDQTIQSSPVYVRQLVAVDADRDTLIGAVAAFLRTTSDRVKWAEDGAIVPSSLDEFDQGLERRYTLLRNEIEDVHATRDEKVRGRMIYRRCAEVQLPLEARPVPSYFVEGVFNLLADDVRVGWHPKFRSLMGDI